MTKLIRGVLVAVEGIDGSGKSTLARTLTEKLQEQLSVVLTKEPGGTAFGQHLRTIVQERTFILDPKAEYLLFAADRAQHMTELIKPALAQNKIVISDRMGDSSLVYQGYGRGLNLAMITTINSWALQERLPDITVYVRIDLPSALARIQQRNETITVFEQERQDFFQRLIAGYETLYKDHTDVPNTHVLIIDGTQPQATVAQQAYDKVMAWLTSNNLLR